MVLTYAGSLKGAIIMGKLGNDGKKWHDNHIVLLVRGYVDGLSNEDIATLLGRKPSIIFPRLCGLGIYQATGLHTYAKSNRIYIPRLLKALHNPEDTGKEILNLLVQSGKYSRHGNHLHYETSAGNNPTPNQGTLPSNHQKYVGGVSNSGEVTVEDYSIMTAEAMRTTMDTEEKRQAQDLRSALMDEIRRQVREGILGALPDIGKSSTNILIVGDSAIKAEVMEHITEECGYKITQVCTAKDVQYLPGLFGDITVYNFDWSEGVTLGE